MKQTILKEISADDSVSYTVYEEISLNSSAFKLNEEMYILADSATFPNWYKKQHTSVKKQAR